MYSYYYDNTKGNNDPNTDNNDTWSNDHRWDNYYGTDNDADYDIAQCVNIFNF